MPSKQTRAPFIEPMLLESSPTLPEGAIWIYELKLDRYRALATKKTGDVHLQSRNNKNFNATLSGNRTRARVSFRRDGNRW